MNPGDTPAAPAMAPPAQYADLTQIVLCYEAIGLPVCHWTEQAIYLWKDNPPKPPGARLNYNDGHSVQEICKWFSRGMPFGWNLWSLYCDAYPGQLVGPQVTRIGIELCRRSHDGDMEARRILAQGPTIVNRYAKYRKHEHRIDHGNL